MFIEFFSIFKSCITRCRTHITCGQRWLAGRRSRGNRKRYAIWNLLRVHKSKYLGQFWGLLWPAAERLSLEVESLGFFFGRRLNISITLQLMKLIILQNSRWKTRKKSAFLGSLDAGKASKKAWDSYDRNFSFRFFNWIVLLWLVIIKRSFTT